MGGDILSENKKITLIKAKEKRKPTKDRPFNVAAYCRVSSPSEQQELSLETQVGHYIDKIKCNALWKNAGVYADTATGRNMNHRYEFRELIDKCRDGNVDLILTKSITRFGRNALDTIAVLRELRDRGVDVYFEVEDMHLLDSETQNFIEIYCAVAQGESENKSHNIKWGIKAGFKFGTSGYQHFTCYGYDFDKKNRKLVIIPEQAKIVKLIFNQRLKGLSYGMISNELAEKDIPSPTGKSIWSRETIRKILSNEKYAGAVMLQKTFVEDFFSGKQKKNIGEKEKYYYANNHEAIIPLGIFEKAQET